MSPVQLPLDLPTATAMGRADFFAAPCNTSALDAALAPGDWPVPRMIFAGPRGSGRSHLAHVFAEAAGGVVLNAQELETDGLLHTAAAIAVDNADSVAGRARLEEALFHLHNAAALRNTPLLLTGTDLPGTWGVQLPDLASRLAAYPVTSVFAPDDTLLTMVLAKLFDDRQLFPDPQVLSFLVRRIERSLDTARNLVAAIDRRALAERRRVTRTLAAEVLEQYVD